MHYNQEIINSELDRKSVKIIVSYKEQLMQIALFCKSWQRWIISAKYWSYFWSEISIRKCNCFIQLDLIRPLTKAPHVMLGQILLSSNGKNNQYKLFLTQIK